MNGSLHLEILKFQHLHGGHFLPQHSWMGCLHHLPHAHGGCHSALF